MTDGAVADIDDAQGDRDQLTTLSDLAEHHIVGLDEPAEPGGAALLEAGLRCTLDRRPRITAETDAIAAARDAIRTATSAGGLAFA